MTRLLDRTGQRFGRLLVVERAPNAGRVAWRCRCDCGVEITVRANNLQSGNTSSCGCQRSESNSLTWARHRDRMRTPHVLTDMAGQRFGLLTGIRRDGESLDGRRRTMWLFRCDCGHEVRRDAWQVRSSAVRSCGCARSAFVSLNRASHGHSRVSHRSSTYSTWLAMRGRCENALAQNYRYYGGRGIRVCGRWTGPYGFENFLADMGDRPDGMSIDRIDPDGHYEPGNCRWADRSTQQRNKSSSTRNTA